VAVTNRPHRGRDQATHPEFRYQPITEPAESAMAGWSAGYQAARVRRQLTPGLISIIAQDGRIAAVYLFFDKLP